MKKAQKDQFIRIVKPKNENTFIDKDNNGQGRGAYICRNTKCVDIALKKKKLSKKVRSNV